MLKLYVRSYIDKYFGNCITHTIYISNNQILVSQLKQIIYEKLSIKASNQKLSTKIANITIVQMTNTFPLSFFYINQESIIYLEVIPDTNNNIITNKTKKKIKSKRSLDRLDDSLLLGTIQESQNEYNDELLNNKNETFDEEDLNKIIKDAVKKENLTQIKELLDLYPNLKIDSRNNGKNALHIACMTGNPDIVKLILKFKVDVNKPSSDNWAPLHLACHNVVRILCLHEHININNNIQGIGTPLHVACQRNSFKTVAFLLNYKADSTLRDNNGVLSINMTTDSLIKNILTKTLNCIKIKENMPKIKENTNEYSFIKTLGFIPPRPSKTVGILHKMGKLIFNYELRYLEIDPFFGYLKRYSMNNSLPDELIETIQLVDIKSCQKISRWYSSSKYHYFEIMNKSRDIYRVDNENTCDKWIEVINMAIIFYKFWNKVMSIEPKAMDYFFKENFTNEVDIIEDISKIKRKEKDFRINQSKSINSDSNDDSLILPRKVKTVKKRSKKKNKEELHSILKLNDELGTGSFGKVYKVIHICTDSIYSMKILSRNHLIRNNLLNYTVSACNLMKNIKNNPFLRTLHYCFQTSDYLIMVLEYCPGEDLSFHLARQLLEENEARFFIAEIILALEHLHNMDVIYLDLKPENILFDQEGHVKLADFGLVNDKMDLNMKAKTFRGSSTNLSLEIVKKIGYGKDADIYGIGAILYEMLTGTPPVYSKINSLTNDINENKIIFPNYISKEARSFIGKIIDRDPENRLGFDSKQEIKNHPFLRGIDWKKILLKQIKPPINFYELKKETESRQYKRNISIELEDLKNNSVINRINNFTFNKK